MAKVIANNIIKAAQTSLEAGQAKYRTYFITYTWYAKYKADVDALLTAAGHAKCIVTK